MGAKGMFWGGYMDTELVCNRELILKIDDVVQKVSPDVVYLNFWADEHQDHRAAAQAAISATRHIKEVLFFEVPTTQTLLVLISSQKLSKLVISKSVHL